MGRPRKVVEGSDSGFSYPLGEDETLSDPLQEESKPVESVESEPAKPEIKGKYATEYFKKNGLPYCTTCGAQFQTDANNLPVCPENLRECPRLA